MRTALFLFAAIAAASAQVPSDPPPFLQITRVPNGSKSGRNYQAAHPAVDVIGLSAVTGVPETWYLEPHLNFASIEALDHALLGWPPPARPTSSAKRPNRPTSSSARRAL